MSKFGEPWSVVDDFDILDAYDSEVASEYSGFESKVYVARTVACVNAMEGVENPEAVKELLEAIRLSIPLEPDGSREADRAEAAITTAWLKIQFMEDEQCGK